MAAARRATARAIDALHRQIAALIVDEVAHYDRKNPREPALTRRIAHSSIEWLSYPPHMRRLADQQRSAVPCHEP